MQNKDDWRLNGQEKYLMNAKLYYLNFVPYSEQWNHEHCEFCFQKISSDPNDENKAYCTTPENNKNSRWICCECFNDFKDDFNWSV